MKPQARILILTGTPFVGIGLGYILYVASELPILSQDIVVVRLSTGFGFILVGLILFSVSLIITLRSKGR